MWPFKHYTSRANGLTKWVEENKPNGFTWDAARLEQFARQPLFVYNHMKRHMRGWHFIKDFSQFRGRAFTKGQNWTMWKKRLGPGTFPIALRTPFEMVPEGRIAGELYLTDTERYFDLDEIMANGVEFRRKQVDVLVPCCHIERIVNKDHNYEEVRTEKIVVIPAWMYVGRAKYWNDFLDAGYHFQRCNTYEPKGLLLPGRYYDFTDMELND
jgi:gamma-glutamylcyclotransferase (GGCT)/AIG2-like uncharacterized protein YtfP